eukprot:SAG11_NODE_92_length_17132_cov_10.277285_1_plen_81_part_00
MRIVGFIQGTAVLPRFRVKGEFQVVYLSLTSTRYQGFEKRLLHRGVSTIDRESRGRGRTRGRGRPRGMLQLLLLNLLPVQ